MAQVFRLTCDTDLSEFVSTAIDSGDLCADAAAAMVGAKGLKCLMDDTTSIYGTKNLTKATTYRARFYFDPNSVTMATLNTFYMNYLRQNGGSSYTMFGFALRKQATYYQFFLSANDDTNTYPYFYSLELTDAPHYVEVQVVQAATAVSSDGTIQCWVDGVSIGSDTGVDNYNLMFDQNWLTWLGVDEVDAGTSGSVYLDDYVVNNDGSEIGEATGWSNISKVNGIASALISKVDGVVVASISKVNGVSV